MPAFSLDAADATELAELLQFLTGWLTADPTRLSPSLLSYVGDPAYELDTLQADLNRFTFLLGGSDGEDLFEPDQRYTHPGSASHTTTSRERTHPTLRSILANIDHGSSHQVRSELTNNRGHNSRAKSPIPERNHRTIAAMEG